MVPPACSRRPTIAVLALLVCAAALGCGGSHRARGTTYHDERMDFSLIRSVIVMPFGNLSGNQPAADRVRDTFMTALQGAGALYVVPPGEVARGIERTGLRTPAAPSPEEVDPTRVPREHRQLFLDAARAVFNADGVIDPKERENFELLEQLLV